MGDILNVPYENRRDMLKIKKLEGKLKFFFLKYSICSFSLKNIYGKSCPPPPNFFPRLCIILVTIRYGIQGCYLLYLLVMFYTWNLLWCLLYRGRVHFLQLVHMMGKQEFGPLMVCHSFLSLYSVLAFQDLYEMK